MINTHDLGIVVGELAALSNKKHWTKADERRAAYLKVAQSCIKEGMSLADFDRAQANDFERRNGLPVTQFEQNDEKRSEALFFQRAIKQCRAENRDTVIGNGAPQYLQGNLGSFVPRSFMKDIFFAQKWYDPLFDRAVCTYVETESGTPHQVGYSSDVQSVAAVVSAEASDQSGNEQDINSVGAVDLHAYNYRTPIWRFSLEALEDVEGMTTTLELFKRFSADRIARGVGRDLMVGNGVNKPLGLITCLAAAGVTPITAAGSSANDGTSATGVNSIGCADVINLYHSVDPAYRIGPKVAFMMSDNTKSSLSRVLDKYGRPIMHFEGDHAFIMGKKILISPSMDNIGSDKIPVLFGDFSFWCTRHATAGDRVQLLKEFPGGIEKGEVGLRTWGRYDGALMYNDGANGNCPLNYLQNHS